MKLHEEWENFLSFCDGHTVYSSKIGIHVRTTKVYEEWCLLGCYAVWLL
jgi:hypothetical protein